MLQFPSKDSHDSINIAGMGRIHISDGSGNRNGVKQHKINRNA